MWVAKVSHLSIDVLQNHDSYGRGGVASSKGKHLHYTMWVANGWQKCHILVSMCCRTMTVIEGEAWLPLRASIPCAALIGRCPPLHNISVQGGTLLYIENEDYVVGA